MNPNTATEYRNLPLNVLTESTTNARQNYYSDAERVLGEWQGQLAVAWELGTSVQEDPFARLAEGQHLITGDQLVQHRKSFTYENSTGSTVTSMEHRAGWDATFSAPKSVSLTALVGNDERVRAAHRESVTVALNELEKYVQAHRRKRSTGDHREVDCCKI